MSKRLRSGFTTGACAAAAAKAAAGLLLGEPAPGEVTIPFPDGSRKSFAIASCALAHGEARAAVLKDAGDDPDVTNGARICATVSFPRPGVDHSSCVATGNLLLCRGEGVGLVTKPGLAVAVGEPAINPVPRRMIAEAVAEVTSLALTVTIAVDGGELLAERTLNRRLGVLGGLSILGTTGIVRPISADAWTATIKASLDVAREAGLREVVLSTGRTSEKGAQQHLALPEEAYAMMGDYLHFSLSEAAARGFATIHLATMWAKALKAALRIPQTHVRHGALEVADGAGLLQRLGADGPLLDRLQASNTAREMYGHLQAAGRGDLISAVCTLAADYGREVSGREVRVLLIDHQARLLAHV